MFCYLFSLSLSLSPLNTRNATVVCILWQLLVCSKKNGLCFLVTVWVRNLCILHRSQSFFLPLVQPATVQTPKKSLKSKMLRSYSAHQACHAGGGGSGGDDGAGAGDGTHATTVFYNFLLLPPLLILHSSTWLLLFKL